MEGAAMKYAIMAILMAATLAMGQDKIIPVTAWPKSVTLDGKVWNNPSVDMCVKAGLRMIPKVKPATPAGKRIKSETFVQDEKAYEMCAYEIVYEDVPTPKPVVPETLVIVPLTNVVFYATTNGLPRGWGLAYSKTNKVEK